MNFKFLGVVKKLQSKLNEFFSALNEHRCRKEPVLEIEKRCTEEEERDVSTHFLTNTKESAY